MYFQFASLLLQRMTIEVDEDFLFSLLDFSKFEGVAGSGQEVYVGPACRSKVV